MAGARAKIERARIEKIIGWCGRVDGAGGKVAGLAGCGAIPGSDSRRCICDAASGDGCGWLIAVAGRGSAKKRCDDAPGRSAGSRGD
jgi:hypothetical protein